MLAVSHFERGLAALEQAAEASSLLEQALRALGEKIGGYAQ